MKQLRLPPGRLAVVAALVTAGALSASALLRAQQAPVLNPPIVLGPNITITWTAVAGASSYRLAAGLQPNQTLLSQNVGNVTTLNVQAPIGTYYVRIHAVFPDGSESAASNERVVQVTSLVVPPTAPTNLAAYINGVAALITWDLGGGGTPASLMLIAGTTSGGSDIGTFPLAVGTQLAVPSVPAGTYFLRMFAVNAGGASPVSNEAQLVMPPGGGCTPPPARSFSSLIFGRYLRLTWTGIPWASGYQLDFGDTPGGPYGFPIPLGPGATSLTVNNAPLGVYYGRLSTRFTCGSQAAGPEGTLNIDGSPPPGPRAPDPAPGQRLPFPNWGQGVIQQLAAERPDLLAQSCREHGGNNRFMFEGVRRLRTRDNRFGLNWKRGNVGDLSQDIVNYNFGSESDEGTRNVYIIDIIGGHCGPNPSWAWIDQTEATRNAGTIGIWTLLPYLDAGFPLAWDEQER
jgi:hypothetical protein